MPISKLKLENTYYDKGFFNVRRDFDRYVRPDDGPIELVLGDNGRIIQGKVNRSANRNGTARIFGGTQLRDWFRANFTALQTVNVDLSSMNRIILT